MRGTTHTRSALEGALSEEAQLVGPRQGYTRGVLREREARRLSEMTLMYYMYVTCDAPLPCAVQWLSGGPTATLINH